MRDGIQNYKAQFSSFAQALQVVPQLTAALNEKRPFRLLSFSGPSCARWLADGAMLHAMNESFPQWPSLFCYFVLPSGPKHLLLNLWITDSQATTPIGMPRTAWSRLAVQFYSGPGLGGKSGFRHQPNKFTGTASPLRPSRNIPPGRDADDRAQNPPVRGVLSGSRFSIVEDYRSWS